MSKPKHYKTELLFTGVDDHIFAKLIELYKNSNLPLDRITVTVVDDVETEQATFACPNCFAGEGIYLPLADRLCCGLCNDCCGLCPPLISMPQMMHYVTPDLHSQDLECRVARAQEFMIAIDKHKGGKRRKERLQAWLDTWLPLYKVTQRKGKKR